MEVSWNIRFLRGEIRFRARFPRVPVATGLVVSQNSNAASHQPLFSFMVEGRANGERGEGVPDRMWELDFFFTRTGGSCFSWSY